MTHANDSRNQTAYGIALASAIVCTSFLFAMAMLPSIGPWFVGGEAAIAAAMWGNVALASRKLAMTVAAPDDPQYNQPTTKEHTK